MSAVDCHKYSVVLINIAGLNPADFAVAFA